MAWKNRTWIFNATGQHRWMQTHAANPVAEPLDDWRVRVYFSSRDADRRSSIGTLEIDLRRPTEILNLSPEPVLSPGDVGLFDDSGVSMGCLVRHGSRRYLYYMGWNLGVTVPWRNSIGLAIAEGPKQEFKRHSLAPVIDRGDADPYSVSYPWVLKEAGEWKAWYGSNLSWGPEQKDMEHVLKFARSKDGIHWERNGETAVGFQSPSEYAMSKPSVLKTADGYVMFYSFRGLEYRIGMAVSKDGVRWERRDSQAGITVADSGWDSESVCYPCVFEAQGKKYLLYNGTRYGETGFGLAEWEGDWPPV